MHASELRLKLCNRSHDVTMPAGACQWLTVNGLKKKPELYIA
jgi:hypothetical protein